MYIIEVQLTLSKSSKSYRPEPSKNQLTKTVNSKKVMITICARKYSARNAMIITTKDGYVTLKKTYGKNTTNP